MNALKIFHGLLLLTFLHGDAIANPRPEEEDGDAVNTVDSDKSAEPKCISAGDFFYPVNVVSEHDFMNSEGAKNNGQKENKNSEENDENDNKDETDDDNEEPKQNDGTRFETSQLQNNNATREIWKRLSVNRYYGVYRDRFFVRNIDGLIHIQLRAGDPFSRATIFGIEDDWRHEYIFARANIFYSMSQKHGAMHAVWGNTFGLEIQYVHYKKSFASLEEATKEKHGVLVLCILFESTGKETTYMDPVVAAAIMSIYPTDKFHVAHGPLDLKALFPNDMTNLQYTGESLVPPCAREAKFVVLLSPRMVAEKQMSKFREVRDHEGKKLVGVFGPYEKRKDSNKENEGIKGVISKNIRLSVESYEVLAGVSLKASIIVVLVLCFGNLSGNL